MVKEIFLEESVKEFVRLVEAGNTLEAIDRFYSAEILQTENGGDAVFGKEKLRMIEESALQLSKIIFIRISGILIDDSQNMVSGEMRIEYLDSKMEVRIVNEAFLQEWKNEKIIRQEFWYHQV